MFVLAVKCHQEWRSHNALCSLHEGPGDIVSLVSLPEITVIFPNNDFVLGHKKLFKFSL